MHAQTILSLLKDWYYCSFVGQSTAKADLIKRVETNIVTKLNLQTNSQYVTADQTAMALAVTTNSIIKHSEKVHCKVGLTGPDTRGYLVVDWTHINASPANVEIVTALDMNIYKNLLTGALS